MATEHLGADAPQDSGDADHAVRSSPRALTKAPLPLWLLAGLGTLAGSFALLVDLSRHAVVENSDSATVALEGQAMLHGNLLLNHWTISLDSFWSIDAIFNGLMIGLLGLGARLVNFVPALLAVLVIAVGSRCASLDSPRSRSVAAIAFVASVLLLPGHALSLFFLQGPWHVGTALWCLVAFLALRTGEFNWSWGVGVVFLAAGLLGDIQALALGVVPVFVAGLAAMARRRRVRSGLSLLVSAPAAVVLALLLREVALSLGTFTFKEAHHTAHLVRMEHSVGHLVAWTLALFGVTPGPYGGPHITPILEAAHALVLAVVVLGVLYALSLLVRAVISHDADANEDDRRSRTDDMLLFAVIGDVGLFEFLTLSNNVLYARYLTAGLIFSTVLTARMLARVPATTWNRRQVIGIGAGIALTLVALVANVLVELRAPAPTSPVTALQRYLVAHHLTRGIGDYWAASVVTLDSGGRVTVRPVVANLHHQIVPDGRQADSSWYATGNFQFLVYQTLPFGRVDATTVARTFGSPTKVARIGQYFVATWDHELAVLGAAFP